MTNGFANMRVDEIKKIYLGKVVHVIYNEDGLEIDRFGKVTSVDSSGKLSGTWGEHKILLGADYCSLND